MSGDNVAYIYNADVIVYVVDDDNLPVAGVWGAIEPGTQIRLPGSSENRVKAA
jgi:hypothetical protein